MSKIIKENSLFINLKMYISFFRGVTIGLTLDGLWVAKYVNPYMSPLIWQFIISFIVIHRFYAKFKVASKRVQSFMKYAIVVGIFLEVIASLILHMYTYRLENIPLYVPFGHALIYILAFYLSKEPILRKYSKTLIPLLLIGTIIYSLTWWHFANDMFGLLCLFIFLVVFYLNKRSRLFMLIIFYFVIYIELMGTATGSWYWAEITFFGMPSANPPSAIGVAYMLLDSLCLLLYKKFNPHIWKRFKSINK